jgi:hypothetical protein
MRALRIPVAVMRSCLLVMFLAFVMPVTTFAAPHAYAQEGGIGSGEAAERVRALYGGRVISVTPANRGGTQGYTVRVDVGGRVKTVFVDSRGSIRGSD